MQRPWSLTAALLLSVASVEPAHADASEAASRLLRRAIVEQRSGSDFALLFALRQLRDPALRPVFLQLVHHERWQVQVHAILGLAELEPGGRIDPWLVTQVSQPAREAVIANAIDMKLIGPEQVQHLLNWEELESMPRILLLSERILAGDAVDAALLNRLSGSSDDRVAGLATSLLVQKGDTSALSVLRDRLAAPGRRDRAATIIWLFEAIRQYRLSAMLPWVREVLDGGAIDDDALGRGVLAILQLDPSDGVNRWEQMLGDAPSSADQVRGGMLLLAASPGVPSAAFERLTGGDELVRRIAAAGKAINDGGDRVEPLIALLELGHARTASWAMSTVDTWEPAQAAPLYARLLDEAALADDAAPEKLSLAVTAAARLFEIEPEAVLTRLAAAPDDSPAQQVILLGLSQSTSPKAGEAARRVRRIGAGTADSLALLLIARHAESIDEPDLRHLGIIASGGGVVAEGAQAKAAWLYLKLSGKLDGALASLLARP